MPCYDPPPPWEGRARESAEKAAALLCGMVKDALEKSNAVPREVLSWYAEHRRIDLTMATYYQTPDPATALRIASDIERAELLLKEMQP